MSTRKPQIIGPRGGTWLSFHGIPSQIIATGEDSLDTYTVSRGTAAPGGGAPPHSHTFDEGFYVLRGEMTFFAGNTSVQLAAGDFVNIRGGTGHYPRNESSEPAELLTICARAGFDRFQLALGERVPGSEGPFPASTPGVLENAIETAKQFGIDLHPPRELFECEPDITVRRRGEGHSLAVVGDVYTMLVTGEETGGTYAIWHAVVHPGGGPPPHIHRREEEAFFVLRGELSLWAEGERLPSAHAGDWVALPRDGEHAFKNETTEPVEMLIMVAPAGLEQMFTATAVPWSDPWQAPPQPSREELERLKALVPQFGVEFRPPPTQGQSTA
jgi:quercetin dioxygenase-like cupin family protein